MTRRHRYEPQPRRGLVVGDHVRVDDAQRDKRCLLLGERGFYRNNVGVILSFLDDGGAANNGAALVEIENMYGQVIRPYINTNELIKVTHECSSTQHQ